MIPPTRLEAALAVATAAGAVCLALSGGPGLGSAAVVLLALVFRGQLPRLVDWTFAHLVVIAVCVAATVPLGVVGGFAILLGWLAAHRVVVLSGREDQRILLLLATLMVLVGSVGTVSIALAPALATYAFATPVAFLRVYGVRARNLEVALSVSTAVLATVFFLLVPRLQGSIIGGLGEEAPADAFADDVTLGDESDDPNRRALVLRAHAYDRDGKVLRGPMYFRGAAFDQFDGRAWSSSGQVRRAATGTWDVRTEVILEPLQGSLIFGPPDTLYAKTGGFPVLQRADGTLDHGQPGRRVSYEVFSRTRQLDTIELRNRSLASLPVLDPRILALAASIAPGETNPAQIAAAMTRWFATGFTYTATPPTPEGDPLSWFLLDSHSGHCEYFASGLAVMLRARRVPARLATGFYSAEFSESGSYIAVRRGHAHAWVEIPISGGWAVLDATPVGELPELQVSTWQSITETAGSAWLSIVLDYDLKAQFDGLAKVGSLVVAPAHEDALRTQTRTGLAGAGLILLGLGGSGTVARVIIWWLSRPPRRVENTDRLLAQFAKARKIIKKRGWPLPDDLPPVESAAWLRTQIGEPADALHELAWVVYRARYAGGLVDRGQVRKLLTKLREIPTPEGRR